MKKIFSKLISLFLLLCILASCLASCDFLTGGNGGNNPPEHVHVDYVEQLKLDMNSPTLKTEVQIKRHIDGDTTHFIDPIGISVDGIIKARYLAVNTPESTGRIEEWGKAASNFTKSKLESAHSILIESNDTSWNRDGNGRFLVFVWYKPTADADWRNLNIEILQNGLAAGSSPMETIYGTTAVAATNQATIEKLHVFSSEKDPDYPYGAAESITLKELRLNYQNYIEKKVAFEGVVSYYGDNTAYVEEFDPETGLTFGVQIFDGYNNALIDVLEVGNRLRVVGYVTEYFGTLQVSDLRYNRYRPTDPANTWILDEFSEAYFPEKTVEEFNSQISVSYGEETVNGIYHTVCLSTSIAMNNLTVVKTYTTQSNGGITLTCKDANGDEIDVRIEGLKNADGKLYVASDLQGKTIDVRGIIDYFNYENHQSYQIKVLKSNDLIIH